jgi:hypothetical protein
MLPDIEPLVLSLSYTLRISLLATIVALGGSLVLSLPAGTGYNLRLKETFIFLAPYSLGVSIIAFFAGFLTGASRSAAIGDLIPALFTLLGGLFVYVFSTSNSHKGVVSFCIVLFSIMLFYGIQDGSTVRETTRELRFNALNEQELRIKRDRRNLGLPEDPPAWLTGTEPK